MASFVKLPSGSWRAIVRRKSRYISETFRRKDDARAWALEAERQIDRGESPKASRTARLRSFSDLVDLHIDDMKEVGRAPGRSKDATLAMLKRELGSTNMADLDRDRLIRFGRKRAEQGAGPVTLGIDIGTIKLVLTHAAAVHGVAVPVEPVELARVALKRLGLVGKGNERDRRPTDEELEKLIAHFDGNPRQIIPMGRVINFAVAIAMRQEEIFRVTWSDLNVRTKMRTIRNRKDRRRLKPTEQGHVGLRRHHWINPMSRALTTAWTRVRTVGNRKITRRSVRRFATLVAEGRGRLLSKPAFLWSRRTFLIQKTTFSVEI